MRKKEKKNCYLVTSLILGFVSCKSNDAKVSSTLIGTRENDEIILTDIADNIIRAGEGSDNVDAGDGNDIVVIVGTHSANQYDGNNIPSTLSAVLSINEFTQERTVSELGATEILRGGAGFDTLEIFGEVDLSNNLVLGFEALNLHSRLTLSSNQWNNFVHIRGYGESYINLNSNSPESVDFINLTIDNIAQLNFDGEFSFNLSTLEEQTAFLSIDTLSIEDSDTMLDITINLDNLLNTEKISDVLSDISTSNKNYTFQTQGQSVLSINVDENSSPDLTSINTMNTFTSIVDSQGLDLSISSGNLVFEDSLDYESDNFYKITLEISEGDKFDFVLIVNDIVEENQIISQESFAQRVINEDSTEVLTGQLNIKTSDILATEPFIVQTGFQGTYGTFSIDSNGEWTYEVSIFNTLTVNTGELVRERITVMTRNDYSTVSSEALSFDLEIIIEGENDILSNQGYLNIDVDTMTPEIGVIDWADTEIMAQTIAGTYGSLSINEFGVWTYTIGGGASLPNISGNDLITETFLVAGLSQEINVFLGILDEYNDFFPTRGLEVLGFVGETQVLNSSPISNPEPLQNEQEWLNIHSFTEAWEFATGNGVNVVVSDTSIEVNHQDLQEQFNLDRSNFNGDSPRAHGTNTAGVIAAAFNQVGSIGGAYEAELRALEGLNYPLSESSYISAIDNPNSFNYNRALTIQDADIVNMSWEIIRGFTNSFSVNSYEYLSKDLRDGLGIILVSSAGNDRKESDSGAHSPNDVRQTINVGALTLTNDNLTSASFTSNGSNIHIAAVGVSLLTSSVGGNGVATRSYSGTSASAPVVSAGVALILDANPNLGWRDVKEILALSTNKNIVDRSTLDPSIGTDMIVTNASRILNNSGLDVSRVYGFGSLNVEKAVLLARSWHLINDTALTSSNEQIVSIDESFAITEKLAADQTVSIIQSPTGENTGVMVSTTEDIFIEQVSISVNLHENIIAQNVRIVLVSPGGTEIVIYDEALEVNNFPTNFSFHTSFFFGEQSIGDWNVQAINKSNGNPIDISRVQLKVYGRNENNRYLFDDNYEITTAVFSDSIGENELNFSILLNSNVDINLNQAEQRIGSSRSFQLNTDDLGNFVNVIGTRNDDNIRGNEFDNIIYGGRGNDIIFFSPGADILDGGEGTDTLSFEFATTGQTLDLSSTSDTITNFENIKGSNYVDQLTGDSNNNIFILSEGGDTIDGSDGNNWLDARDSQEGITVSLENQSVNTGIALGDNYANINNIIGSSFVDHLIGNAENNFFFGDNGNDTIDGGEGNDIVLYGGTEAIRVDLSNSLLNEDTLISIEGIRGGSGADILVGNEQNNFFFYSAGNDDFSGGDGIDRIIYTSLDSSVTISLIDNTARGDSFIHNFSSIEDIFSSNFDDTLIGNSEQNFFTAKDGDDLIILGSAGNDLVDGGEGFDTLSFENANSGITEINFIDGELSLSDGRLISITSIEHFTGSMNNDIISGNNLDNYLRTLAGDDDINGLGGDDIIEVSGSGNNNINGGDGNDRISFLDLNSMNNIVYGGLGIDVLDFSNYEFSITVNVDSGIVSSNAVEKLSFSSIEGIFGSQAIDVLEGSNLEDYFFGAGDADIINTLKGDDVISVVSNIEIIDGGEGIDEISFSHKTIGENLYLDTFQDNNNENGEWRNIEEITLTDFSDTIRQTDTFSLLTRSSLDVSNFRNSFSLDTKISLGDGDDTFGLVKLGQNIDAGEGNDVLNIWFNEQEDLLVNLEESTVSDGTNTSFVENFENVNFFNSEFGVEVHGSNRDNIFFDTEFDDTFFGSDGYDEFFSTRGGNDTYNLGSYFGTAIIDDTLGHNIIDIDNFNENNFEEDNFGGDSNSLDRLYELSNGSLLVILDYNQDNFDFI